MRQAGGGRAGAARDRGGGRAGLSRIQAPVSLQAPLIRSKSALFPAPAREVNAL